MLLSELDHPRNKSILRRTVYERSLLQDASNSEDRGGRYFAMARINRFQQILCRIVDARNEISKAFRVRSPEDNDLVKRVNGFESPKT